MEGLLDDVGMTVGSLGRPAKPDRHAIEQANAPKILLHTGMNEPKELAEEIEAHEKQPATQRRPALDERHAGHRQGPA